MSPVHMSNWFFRAILNVCLMSNVLFDWNLISVNNQFSSSQYDFLFPSFHIKRPFRACCCFICFYQSFIYICSITALILNVGNYIVWNWNINVINCLFVLFHYTIFCILESLYLHKDKVIPFCQRIRCWLNVVRYEDLVKTFSWHRLAIYFSLLFFSNNFSFLLSIFININTR